MLAWGRRAAARVWRIAALTAALLSPSCAAAQQALQDRATATLPMSTSSLPEVPDILGTIALHIPPSPTSTRWVKLMQASLAQSRLMQLVDGLRVLTADDKVLAVQSSMSAAIRTVSTDNCSDDGYWAPAQETLARGMGDCFDVAIAKMEALRSLGVADTDLYLTTGRFQAGAGSPTRETVALLVRVGQRFWLLPDWTSHAIEVEGPEVRDSGYTPVITYGVGASWVHGRKVWLAALAAAGEGPARH